MNQILQVKDNKKQLKPIDTKKIFIFLLILAIIAGLGFGGYYIYENIMNGNIKLPAFITKVPEKQSITIILNKVDRNILIINVQSETSISKVTYGLNGEQIQAIEEVNELFVEETINMPTGENSFYISVIDINGKETTKQEVFIVEPPKPVIDLAVVGNDIKITITSEVELSEITYKWNTNSEKKENMSTYKERLTFEKQLEIPIGQNTLTIVARDINGEVTEKVQEIRGVTKPTTKTEVIGEYLHFTVKAKENIRKVEFIFNGQKFLMNTETFGETKTVHYKVKLIEGMNYLTVTSTTQSGGTDTISYEHKFAR